MAFQIAEGGGIPLPAGEEMLVEAEDLRTAGGMPLPELTLESAAEVALDGGGADAFPPAQAAAVDAVQVLAEDHLLVGFAGPLAFQDARKPLSKVAAATQTTP